MRCLKAPEHSHLGSRRVAPRTASGERRAERYRNPALTSAMSAEPVLVDAEQVLDLPH